MEGPSLRILSDDLQILKNQKIKKVYGNAKFDKELLLKQTIKDVFAFGKRLIIQLDDYALTIHFLMYGSYRINSERPQMNPRLALVTPKYSFFVYNCSIKCFKISDIKNHLPMDIDILSEDWNMPKVIDLIKCHKNETIDDILLDQEIFPGVGNIIKNEALFLSKTSPLKKVSKIQIKKLKEIAQQTRLFSQKFLELRKIFQLKKHLQIYRKKECPICKSTIIRKKTGKRQRWSFFCPICQN